MKTTDLPAQRPALRPPESLARPRRGAHSSFLALAVAAGCLAIGERPARACGGCFARPTENTVVTDHRMAFSVSTRQTVLWDQIKYSGNPSEFSWVLPVQPGAVVELSHDEWFAALDAMTNPAITGPTVSCGGGGPGCAFGGEGDDSNSATTGAGGGGGVQVLSQSVVGPYDTVTLQSSDPNALEAWLDVNGFALPDAFRPTIAAYVGAGFDFIALRLQPGQGVQAMQPVRVVTPGADATLPLRMVAAGVGAQVGITLYVISEGRYEAQSPFFNAVVDDSKLVWFQSENRSNYQELSQQIMQSNNARTWLTEYSKQTSLLSSAQPPAYPTYCGSSYAYGSTLADVYFNQCRCKPSNLCPAGDASGADLDAASPDAACNPDPCAGFDDVDTALVGIHPEDAWVTRMRALLPVDALSEGDLHVQASAAQTAVSNQHSTETYSDPNYAPCGTKGGCSATPSRADPFANWLAVGAFTFAGASLVRRRVRR